MPEESHPARDEQAELAQPRPQLLYTKFQRLKNTTKLAKVCLIDELPIVAPGGSPMNSN